MIGTEALVERLRSLEDALAKQCVAHLAIFGSRARGDAREESDLDMLIDVAPGRKFSLLDLVKVERQVTDEVGLPVSLVMRRSLLPDFAATIENDIVEVF